MGCRHRRRLRELHLRKKPQEPRHGWVDRVLDDPGSDELNRRSYLPNLNLTTKQAARLLDR